MPNQTYAPSGVTMATIRSTWLRRLISQNGDAVQLGGDATTARPLGVVVDGTTVNDAGTEKILLTYAGPGETAELYFGAAIDVSAAGALVTAITASGAGKAAASGDYVAAQLADPTAGDIADTNVRLVIVCPSANVLA